MTPDGTVEDSATGMDVAGEVTASPSAGLVGEVLGIAAREYQVAVRTRLAPGAILLFALLTTTVVQLGTTGVGPDRIDTVVSTLAELSTYVVPLAALGFGYDAIVGSREDGSLTMLLALPVSSTRIAVGTYLGLAGILVGSILFGFLPGAVLTVAYFGGGVGAYAVVALAAVLVGLSFLAVGLLISTVTRGKAQALGAALTTWLWFVLLHDLVALALVTGFDLSGTAVSALVLLNPADCFRVVALSQVDTLAGGFGAALSTAGMSVPVAVLGLLLWSILPVALAGALLRRRV